jgi:hypothetical protein
MRPHRPPVRGHPKERVPPQHIRAAGASDPQEGTSHMKRFLSAFALVALMLVAVNAMAAGQPAKAVAKKLAVKGEIVDLGCYLDHGARGADHKGCATKCIANGMPFGLLTAEGKLYLLTMNHDNPDPFNQCKDMAAQTVVVTGTVLQRNGVMAVDVADVKPAK